MSSGPSASRSVSSGICPGAGPCDQQGALRVEERLHLAYVPEPDLAMSSEQRTLCVDGRLHIQRRAPPNFEVRSEVRLTIEPQRADMLLLRRIGLERQDDQARVLRRLWPLLGLVT